METWSDWLPLYHFWIVIQRVQILGEKTMLLVIKHRWWGSLGIGNLDLWRIQGSCILAILIFGCHRYNCDLSLIKTAKLMYHHVLDIFFTMPSTSMIVPSVPYLLSWIIYFLSWSIYWSIDDDEKKTHETLFCFPDCRGTTDCEVNQKSQGTVQYFQWLLLSFRPFGTILLAPKPVSSFLWDLI
jgi:hypothetical protein